MHGRTNEINNLQAVAKLGEMPSSEADESQVGDSCIIQVFGLRVTCYLFKILPRLAGALPGNCPDGGGMGDCTELDIMPEAPLPRLVSICPGV